MQETLFCTDRISARKRRAVQQQHFEGFELCGGPIHRQGHQQDRKGRCSVRPSYHPARHSVLRRHRRQLARRTRMRRHARASTPRQEWIQHPYSVRVRARRARSPGCGRGGRAAGAARRAQAAHSRPGRGGMGQVAERNAGAARAAAQVAYLPPHAASEAGVGGSTADLCSRRQNPDSQYSVPSPPIDFGRPGPTKRGVFYYSNYRYHTTTGTWYDRNNTGLLQKKMQLNNTHVNTCLFIRAV